MRAGSHSSSSVPDGTRQAGTVTRAVEASLARIAARDPELLAWKYIDPDRVRRLASERDSLPEARRGPLHGMLIGVKDNFDTSDMPTGYGSPIYEGNRPSADAAAVALLKSSGAVIVGKTVSTEFAGWPPAVTRNPRDPSRTPGGSSSGSAAAVADGMVTAALGTQTLGSVIRPSSYCGVVGFKPTFGRINRAGVKPLAESLDTIGIIARSVTDADRVYRALSSAPATNFTAQAPKLAFCRGPNWHLADDDARQAIERFVDALRAAGLSVGEIDVSALEPLAAAAKLIQDFELWRGLAFERTRHFDQLSPAFQAGVRAAETLTFDDYNRAQRLGRESRRRFPDLLAGHDAILSLSATGAAPAGLGSTGDPVMNSTWTLLHVPCVTIPVLQGRSGLPIGLQVIAPRNADDVALRVAHWLHEFHGRAQRAPAEAGAPPNPA